MADFPDTRPSLLLQVQKGGNAVAWEEFAQLYRPIIYRMARARGMQEADAQDLAQQVLVSVHGAIGRWEQRDANVRFRNWLSKIARNEILKTLTRMRPDKGEGGSSIIQQLNSQTAEDFGLTQLLEEEYRRELYLQAAAVVQAEVNDQSWQVFQWTTLQNISIEEAAARLHKSVGSVYAMRSRIMRRLRDAVRAIEELEQ